MVKKFVANAEETRRLLLERQQDTTAQTVEIDILNRYMPQQMDRTALDAVVHSIVHEMKLEGPKAMGAVMAELKKSYTGQYDGKMASEVVRSILA